MHRTTWKHLVLYLNCMQFTDHCHWHILNRGISARCATLDSYVYWSFDIYTISITRITESFEYLNALSCSNMIFVYQSFCVSHGSRSQSWEVHFKLRRLVHASRWSLHEVDKSLKLQNFLLIVPCKKAKYGCNINSVWCKNLNIFSHMLMVLKVLTELIVNHTIISLSVSSL